MAGALTISTLNNDTGPLATQNGMTGICKGWISFAGGAGTITDSFNFSSMTKVATGRYTFSFTSAMANSTYTIQCNGDLGTNGGGYFQSIGGYSTTAINEIRFYRVDNQGFLDPTRGYVAVFGS